MAVIPRALVKILDDWADRGTAPPANAYPQTQDKTLVSVAEYRKQFPKITGLDPPTVINELVALDFGPSFGPTGGVQSLNPRALARSNGRRYGILVPRPGPNGDAVAGVDAIWTRAPIGTNVGWNMQNEPRRPDLCGLEGSYVPLAKTKAERLENGDSRPSLQERYKNHEGFVNAVKQAAQQLVSERFLLQEDANILIKAAEDSDVLKMK